MGEQSNLLNVDLISKQDVLDWIKQHEYDREFNKIIYPDEMAKAVDEMKVHTTEHELSELQEKAWMYEDLNK